MVKRTPLAAAFCCAAALAPEPGAAHPHVFVDADLKIIVSEDGSLEGIEVTWTYDALYSLLILTDLEMDNDGDGVLEPEELERLKGFDLKWIEGFEGDSYARRDGVPVALGAPEWRDTSLVDDLITSTHFRAATGSAEGSVFRLYDPSFYTAYTLAADVTVDGPCRANVVAADLDAAYTLVEELLYTKPAEELEEGYPGAGEAFADTVTLTCAE